MAAGFKYNPNDAIECLPAGDYDAELTSAEEKVSKAGNPMLEVVWSIMGAEARLWTVKDWVTNPTGIFKLKQIARAWQQMRDFDMGTFDMNEHVGKLIRVSLTVQTNDRFPDRNNVVAYREPLCQKPPAFLVARPAAPAFIHDPNQTEDQPIPF